MATRLPFDIREAIVDVCGKAFHYKDPFRHFMLACGVPPELYDRFSEDSKYKIPYSLYRMFRHMAAVRLRLMWKAGVRSWLDPVQLGGLLKSLTWAAVGALGKRSLKRSGLTRRLFAPGRDDARPRFTSAHPSRPEFTR